MSAQPIVDRSTVIERAFSQSIETIVPLRDRSIGALLIDAGRLTPEEAERVMRLQGERGMRFGDAALQLGLLDEDDIRFALDRQYEHAVLPLGDPSLAPEVVAAFQPGHRTTEALRHLRTQLQLRWFDTTHHHRSISIVSAEGGVGRSYIAANLAVLFAQLGERTLLVDADLREPRQHRLFKLDNEVGLSTVLSDRAGLERVCTIEPFKRLAVLPSGPPSPNPQELLSRAQFTRLMHAARERFDVVLVDTPAWLAGADAQIVSARAGAAVLVARPNHTSLRVLERMVESMRDSGTALIGSVVNEI